VLSYNAIDKGSTHGFFLVSGVSDSKHSKEVAAIVALQKLSGCEIQLKL